MTDVCVHGLGYIGLPTAAMFANHGFDVVGFDVDEDVRRMLRSGDVHIQEPELQSFVDEAVDAGHLTVSADVPAADVHAVCVPTPLDEGTKSPDLQYVTAAGEAISRVLRPGDTVLLESTVPPGTTRTTLCPVLERSGLTAGVDFSVAHCPETVLPGNVIAELRQNDRIVGGIDARSADIAASLYESLGGGDTHPPPTPRPPSSSSSFRTRSGTRTSRSRTNSPKSLTTTTSTRGRPSASRTSTRA